jgi:hypothetical protein
VIPTAATDYLRPSLAKRTGYTAHRFYVDPQLILKIVSENQPPVQALKPAPGSATPLGAR